MVPSFSVYPKFVPDQVLTSGDLNSLFSYLDEQGRLTRTRLIGIGIVCGLQVKFTADPASVTITKGCGVTSKGYLVVFDEDKVYTHYKDYDKTKPEVYDKFENVDPLDQLCIVEDDDEEDDEDEDRKPLTPEYLNNKVVLIFVELPEKHNKNCDPNSCDDKGNHIHVRFIPMLVDKDDATQFLPVIGEEGEATALSLPEIRMPRFDVASTSLNGSKQLFSAYLKIFRPQDKFLERTGNALLNAYTTLKPLFPGTDDENDDLFELETDYDFLLDGNMDKSNLLNIQYYYDFFSDLISAYNELRQKAHASVCVCCPDENTFPRHLMLGEAIGFDEQSSAFRQRFISSPLFCRCEEDSDVLRELLKKIIAMLKNVSIPPHLVPSKPGLRRLEELRTRAALNPGTLPVVVTPSILGKEFLSEKAIPFYYKTKGSNEPYLFKLWNPERTKRKTERQILSYRSYEYRNPSDDFVKNPLMYDLEPYNFFRIEGHIGKQFDDVLGAVSKIRNDNRLPFNIVALGSDFPTALAIFTSQVAKNNWATIFSFVTKYPCYFEDLLSMYLDITARHSCCTAKSASDLLNVGVKGAQVAADVKKVKLENKAFLRAKLDYDAVPGTVAFTYKEMVDSGVIKERFSAGILPAAVTGDKPASASLAAIANKINLLSETIPDDINEFDFDDFDNRHEDFAETATAMRKSFTPKFVADNFEGIAVEALAAKTDPSCLRCIKVEMDTLMVEFVARALQLIKLEHLEFYLNANPGIQHKAGVPTGGTFIIVYHEKKIRKVDLPGLNLPIAILDRETVSVARSARPTGGSEKIAAAALAKTKLDLLIKDLSVKEDDDTTFNEAFSTIENGVVIADFYLPYLCGSDCLPVQATPPAPDKSVVADAGQDQTITLVTEESGLQHAATNLEGKASGPDAGKLESVWKEASNDASVKFEDIHKLNTKVDFSKAGKYTFELTVTDSVGGGTAKDEMEITVNRRESQPLTVNAGGDITIALPVNRVNLTGSVTNPDGGTLDILWDISEGPNRPAISSPNSLSTSVTGLVQGNYRFKLTVKDEEHIPASGEVKVTVLPKDCGNLSTIRTSFQVFATGASQDQILELTRRFQSLNDIASFFKAVGDNDVSNLSSEKQLDFFQAERINERLVNWLVGLSQIIKDSDRSVIHALSLKLYAVLVQLGIYIVCSKNEDFDKERITMIKPFLQMESDTNIWGLNIKQGGFLKVRTAEVKEVINIIAAELAKIIANGEATTTKPGYATILKKISNNI
jgi:hypothetical protein